MKRFVWLLVAFMAVAFCLPCRGADDKEDIDSVYTAITPETFMKIMQKEGYSVSLESNGQILWKQDGYTTWILFYKRNRHVAFHARAVSKETSLEEVNQFNKKYLWGKAFMPEKGQVILKVDLDLRGGITEKNIVYFCKRCRNLFPLWRQTVL